MQTSLNVPNRLIV